MVCGHILQCMFEEYAKDNQYACFDVHIIAVSASETQFNTVLTDGWTDKQTGGWFENWNAYETLLGGEPFPCSPEINRLVSLFPKNRKLFFLCSMFPNIAFVPCSTQNVTFVPCSPGINVISPVSQNPWKGLHYVDVIFSYMLTR